MKAEDVFTIAKVLPRDELKTLEILIKNHLTSLKKPTKISKTIITNLEARNYLLKTVFNKKKR